MLTKGLMAGTWVDHLVAIKVVLRVVTAQLFSYSRIHIQSMNNMEPLGLCSPSNLEIFSY
jgi:hypothetical protein